MNCLRPMRSVAGLLACTTLVTASLLVVGCADDEAENGVLPMPSESSPGGVLPHEAGDVIDNAPASSQNSSRVYDDGTAPVGRAAEQIRHTEVDPEFADVHQDFELYQQQAVEQLTGEHDELGALNDGLNSVVNADAPSGAGYQVQMDETSRILMEQAEAAHQRGSPEDVYPQVPAPRQQNPNVPEQPGMEPEMPAQ